MTWVARSQHPTLTLIKNAFLIRYSTETEVAILPTMAWNILANLQLLILIHTYVATTCETITDYSPICRIFRAGQAEKPFLFLIPLHDRHLL